MNLNDIYFGPHFVKTSLLSLKIFNPFILSDAETYAILTKYDSEDRSKKLTIHALMYKLDNFSTNIIPFYRKLRLALDKKQFSYKQVTNIVEQNNNVLIKGINKYDIELSIDNPINSDLTINIIKCITSNLLNHLDEITNFLDYIRSNKIDNLFKPFISLCNEIPISNPYQLVATYKECQLSLTNFLLNFDKLK